MVRISVVTVCFNGAKTIVDCLDSVASQEYGSTDHVVIDGGSQDDTLAILESWGRHPLSWRSEPDRGIYDAMNKGLRLATGDVVGFLNADDQFADRCALSSIAKAFGDPRIDACYGDLVYVRKDDVSHVVRYWRSGRVSRAAFSFGLMPAHPTFYVRRSVLERCGLFDLSLPSANDFEFTARYLVRRQLRAAYIPRVLVRMRLGGVSNSSLRNVFRQNFAIFTAMRKNRITPSYLYPLGKALVKAKQYLIKPKVT